MTPDGRTTVKIDSNHNDFLNDMSTRMGKTKARLHREIIEYYRTAHPNREDQIRDGVENLRRIMDRNDPKTNPEMIRIVFRNLRGILIKIDHGELTFEALNDRLCNGNGGCMR